MVMEFKNSRVFNFAIFLKWRKTRKFDAREIYMFYRIVYSHPLKTTTQWLICIYNSYLVYWSVRHI